MHVILELPGSLAGVRSARWIGFAILVAGGLWYGPAYLSERSRFNETAERLEAALPAPLPGWSAPAIERTRENGEVRIAARYRKGGETLILSIHTFVLAVPELRAQFEANSKREGGAESSMAQADGRAVYLSLSLAMSYGRVFVASRVIVHAGFIQVGKPENKAEVRADILAYLGKVNYAAIEAAIAARR